MFTLTDFKKRLLITLGLLFFWRILCLIPAPGINFEGANEFFSLFPDLSGLGPPISIVALGLIPYISAYVMVEIFSLLIRPLKSWRGGGASGRLKLRRTAYVLTILIALIQANGVIRGLQAMNNGEYILYSALAFKLILSVTLVAGTFLILWIANMITNKGVGQGVSVILVTSYIAGVFWDITHIWTNKRSLHEGVEVLLTFLFFVVIAVALISLIVKVERRYRKVQIKYDDGTEAYLPIKLTTAGTVPVAWGLSFIIVIPATIAMSFDTPLAESIANVLSPGHYIYEILSIIGLFLFYFLFTSFFYQPQKIIDFLKKNNASIIVSGREKTTKYIDKILLRTALIGASYLLFLVYLPRLGLWLFEFSFGGLGLIVTVAIGLDLLGEIRLRNRSGLLVKVAEFHDVPTVGIFRSVLESKGIPCLLRGYYHRALLYFFGPYIEVSVLVPEEMAVEANALLEKYIETGRAGESA